LVLLTADYTDTLGTSLGGFLELTGIAVLVPRQNGKARPVLNFECLVHRINFELWSRFAEIVLMASLMQLISRELSLN